MIRLGKHHAREPGVEVDEHLLQPEEVPRAPWTGWASARGWPAPRAAPSEGSTRRSSTTEHTISR